MQIHVETQYGSVRYYFLGLWLYDISHCLPSDQFAKYFDIIVVFNVGLRLHQSGYGMVPYGTRLFIYFLFFTICPRVTAVVGRCSQPTTAVPTYNLPN